MSLLGTRASLFAAERNLAQYQVWQRLLLHIFHIYINQPRVCSPVLSQITELQIILKNKKHKYELVV